MFHPALRKNSHRVQQHHHAWIRHEYGRGPKENKKKHHQESLQAFVKKGTAVIRKRRGHPQSAGRDENASLGP